MCLGGSEHLVNMEENRWFTNSERAKSSVRGISESDPRDNGIKRLPEMNLFCHGSYPSPGQACLYICHDDSFSFCVFHLTCVPLISTTCVAKRV